MLDINCLSLPLLALSEVILSSYLFSWRESGLLFRQRGSDFSLKHSSLPIIPLPTVLIPYQIIRGLALLCFGWSWRRWPCSGVIVAGGANFFCPCLPRPRSLASLSYCWIWLSGVFPAIVEGRRAIEVSVVVHHSFSYSRQPCQGHILHLDSESYHCLCRLLQASTWAS